MCVRRQSDGVCGDSQFSWERNIAIEEVASGFENQKNCNRKETLSSWEMGKTKENFIRQTEDVFYYYPK